MAKDMTDREVVQKFEKLRQRVVKLGVSGAQLQDLPSFHLLKAPKKRCERLLKYGGRLALLFSVTMVCLLIVWIVEWPLTRYQVCTFTLISIKEKVKIVIK